MTQSIGEMASAYLRMVAVEDTMRNSIRFWLPRYAVPAHPSIKVAVNLLIKVEFKTLAYRLLVVMNVLTV
jgi:hypothetical protein